MTADQGDAAACEAMMTGPRDCGLEGLGEFVVMMAAMGGTRGGRGRRGSLVSARASWVTGACIVVDGAQRKANR